MRRRDFLTSVAGACALAAVPSGLVSAATPMRRPRYFVNVFLVGGVDSLYCFDPKTADTVTDRIWIPYAASEIVESRGLRLAPPAAALAPFSDRIAVINGVETSTVAHETGELQAHFMSRDNLDPFEPSFAAEIGAAAAPDSPLHEVRFGRRAIITMRRRPGGRSISINPGGIEHFRAMAEANPRQFDDTLAQLDRRQRSSSDVRVQESIAATLHLLHAVRRLPPARPIESDFNQATYPELLQLMPPGPLKTYQTVPAQLRRTFSDTAWLFEHDLVPAVWMDTSLNFDTHTYNQEQQANSIALVARVLAEFLAHLSTIRSVRGAPLIDEVAIMVNSELGRFPFLNSFEKGKDHFPPMPVVLVGNGVRAGMYGETDRDMIGRPVSMATGRPGPKPTVLTIDDAGATLRHWFGKPQPPWLRGRPFEFLFA